MKSKIIYFLLGGALGAIGYYGFQYLSDDVVLGESNAELAQLQEKVRELQKEKADLEASLNSKAITLSAKPSQMEEEVKYSSPSTKNVISDDVVNHLAKGMEQQAVRQTDIYRNRLNLTDEQAAAFEDFILAQHQQMFERIEVARGGGSVSIKAGEMIKRSDLRNLAEEVLTPEQLEGFDTIQREQRESRNEMMATAQMSQYAPMLGLSDEQKDEMYSLFYSEADQMGEGVSGDEMNEVRRYTDERVAEILTPEQAEMYQSRRDDQMKGTGSATRIFMGR